MNKGHHELGLDLKFSIFGIFKFYLLVKVTR